MTEQEAIVLASRISEEDRRVLATPQPKPSKTQWYVNSRFVVHLLLKYGQRQSTVNSYEEWDSLRMAWNQVAEV